MGSDFLDKLRSLVEEVFLNVDTDPMKEYNLGTNRAGPPDLEEEAEFKTRVREADERMNELYPQLHVMGGIIHFPDNRVLYWCNRHGMPFGGVPGAVEIMDS